jgi:hypothetical protein
MRIRSIVQFIAVALLFPAALAAQSGNSTSPASLPTPAARRCLA